MSISVILLSVISFFKIPGETVLLYYICGVLGLCSMVVVFLVPFSPYKKETLTCRSICQTNISIIGHHSSLNALDHNWQESEPLVLNENQTDHEFNGDNKKGSISECGSGSLRSHLVNSEDKGRSRTADEPEMWSYSCSRQFRTIEFWVSSFS